MKIERRKAKIKGFLGTSLGRAFFLSILIFFLGGLSVFIARAEFSSIGGVFFGPGYDDPARAGSDGSDGQVFDFIPPITDISPSEPSPSGTRIFHIPLNDGVYGRVSNPGSDIALYPCYFYDIEPNGITFNMAAVDCWNGVHWKSGYNSSAGGTTHKHAAGGDGLLLNENGLLRLAATSAGGFVGVDTSNKIVSAVNTNEDFYLVVWVELDASTNSRIIWHEGFGPENFILSQEGQKIRITRKGQTQNFTRLTGDLTLDVPHLIVYGHNANPGNQEILVVDAPDAGDYRDSAYYNINGTWINQDIHLIDNDFLGVLYSASIFNRQLSEQEISDIWNSGKGWRTVDLDDDGWVEESAAPGSTVANNINTFGGDCNDYNSNAHLAGSISFPYLTVSRPAAAEVCDNVDNDCDGQVDEDDPLATYYRDADGDGFGAGPSLGDFCLSQKPANSATNDTDCNDTAGSGASVWVNVNTYPDADNDTYGQSGSSATMTCVGETVVGNGVYVRPANRSFNTQDCNDLSASIKPGATEICDGVDNDCDNRNVSGANTGFLIDEEWRIPASTSLGTVCSVGNGLCSNTGNLRCSPTSDGAAAGQTAADTRCASGSISPVYGDAIVTGDASGTDCSAAGGDSNACTHTDKCVYTTAGDPTTSTCQGTTYGPAPADAFACMHYECTGTAVAGIGQFQVVIEAADVSSCFIGTGTNTNGTIVSGGCYDDYRVPSATANPERNPANACQRCDVSFSRLAWATAPNSTACNQDANLCTTGACWSGTCTNPDTHAGAEKAVTCDAGSLGSCVSTGGTCDPTDGLCDILDSDIDAGYCVISNTCVAQNEQESDYVVGGSLCKICNSNIASGGNKRAWSNASLGASCADSAYCNGAETCSATGTCRPATPVSCPSASCQQGVCIEASDSCGSTPLNGTACEDGDACTGGSGGVAGPDSCVNGTCTSGGNTCNDGNSLTNDVCISGGGGSSSGGVVCDISSVKCSIGGVEYDHSECVSGTPGFACCAVCDVNSSTTAASPVNNGQSCDDGDECFNMVCSAGACVQSNINADCTDDGNGCTDDVCNAGACTHPVQVGQACGTDNCVTGQVCTAAGTCSAGNPVSCTHLDTQCITGSCNPADGSCIEDFKVAGTLCNADDYGCTQGDACDTNGECIAGLYQNCDDGNSCNVDECNNNGVDAFTCEHNPASSSCIFGVNNCVPNGQINPADDCQYCNSATPGVWSWRPEASVCSDGNPGTTPDKCEFIAGGPALECRGPDHEICNDAVDNDADGLVNFADVDDCECDINNPGGWEACGTDTGVCDAGHHRCEVQPDGRWRYNRGFCDGAFNPGKLNEDQPLDCGDNLDNDCDGPADEGTNICGGCKNFTLPPFNAPAGTAENDACDSPVDSDECTTDGDRWECISKNLLQCVDRNGSQVDVCFPPGVDENCDGDIDESCGAPDILNADVETLYQGTRTYFACNGQEALRLTAKFVPRAGAGVASYKWTLKWPDGTIALTTPVVNTRIREVDLPDGNTVDDPFGNPWGGNVILDGTLDVTYNAQTLIGVFKVIMSDTTDCHKPRRAS